MYKLSTPPANFDKLISSGKTKEPMWFMDYELSIEDSESIINHHSKNNNLTKHEKSRISHEVYLGCSPKFK